MGIKTTAARMMALILAAAFLNCRLAIAAGDFSYTSPTGITFRVSEDGLAEISTPQRQIASGSWSAFCAEDWFKDGGSQKVRSDPTGARSLEIIDDHHVRVRQVLGDLACTYDYSFDGEDALISTRVENNNSEASLNIVGFAGLTFHFALAPSGLMPVQTKSYFQYQGLEACHPGFWQPIGATYAMDDSIGVGTSPWKAGMVRTLTLWDYADWSLDKREKDPDRLLRYFVVSPVPARGAVTFDFVIRVSPNRDWTHLLEKYRQYFQETYGPVQYKLDARWIATDYMNQDESAITPENPYGFHGTGRRIDTVAGAETFCDRTILAIKQSGGQGIILWGQGGQERRGGMYRPDFDVLPPEVLQNWPLIARRYQEAGLKLGVAARPTANAVRADWDNDAIIGINPDDPSTRDLLYQRFANMMKLGCSLFYLDSFGSSLEDVPLMQFLRQKLGPNVLTFCEHQSDTIMPYSGGYSETTFTPGEDDSPGSYRLWSDSDNWRIYQWLCPGCQLASRLYHGTPRRSDLDPDQWFYRANITPLLPTDNFPLWLFSISDIENKYVNPDGSWR